MAHKFPFHLQRSQSKNKEIRLSLILSIGGIAARVAQQDWTINQGVGASGSSFRETAYVRCLDVTVRLQAWSPLLILFPTASLHGSGSQSQIFG